MYLNDIVMINRDNRSFLQKKKKKKKIQRQQNDHFDCKPIIVKGLFQKNNS